MSERKRYSGGAMVANYGGAKIEDAIELALMASQNVNVGHFVYKTVGNIPAVTYWYAPVIPEHWDGSKPHFGFYRETLCTVRPDGTIIWHEEKPNDPPRYLVVRSTKGMSQYPTYKNAAEKSCNETKGYVYKIVGWWGNDGPYWFDADAKKEHGHRWLVIKDLSKVNGDPKDTLDDAKMDACVDVTAEGNLTILEYQPPF